MADERVTAASQATMTHRAHVQQPWFDLIASERKIYEGRLDRGTWQKLKPGDILLFLCNSLEVTCQVKRIHKFASFAEAYDAFGEQLLPGVTARDDAAAVYHQFYTALDELQAGVLAVEIERIEK